MGIKITASVYINACRLPLNDDTMIVEGTLVSFGADVYVNRSGAGNTGAVDSVILFVSEIVSALYFPFIPIDYDK